MLAGAHTKLMMGSLALARAPSEQAFVGDECVGVVISKLDLRKGVRRGYVGMLAVDSAFRKRGIGSTLVRMSIEQMREMGCDEVRFSSAPAPPVACAPAGANIRTQVVLEAEESNKGALALYLNLGFIKSKRLLRYYLNGSDAFRLKLWFS